MLDSSDTVTVSGGQFTVNIEGGMPKVYHPGKSEEVESDDVGNGTSPGQSGSN